MTGVEQIRGALRGVARAVPADFVRGVGGAALDGAVRRLRAPLTPRDPMDLTGRVVFITGAARGLGAECARQAHARGASVALVGRRLQPLEDLAAALGERTAAFEADVSDLAALERAARDAADHFGGIDIVIANAGVAPPSDSILTIDPDAFERTVDIDLLGQWRTARATLPYVVERQGHVLMVASIYAFFNGFLNASYAASKAGVEQIARALRVELAAHGATAGVAYLGFIDTDLARDAFELDHVDDVRAALPAFTSRPMSAPDVARAVLDGAIRRSARVTAPGWVAPALHLRGPLAALDAAFLHNPRLIAAIHRSERAAADKEPNS